MTGRSGYAALTWRRRLALGAALCVSAARADELEEWALSHARTELALRYSNYGTDADFAGGRSADWTDAFVNASLTGSVLAIALQSRPGRIFIGDLLGLELDSGWRSRQWSATDSGGAGPSDGFFHLRWQGRAGGQLIVPFGATSAVALEGGVAWRELSDISSGQPTTSYAATPFATLRFRYSWLYVDAGWLDGPSISLGVFVRSARLGLSGQQIAYQRERHTAPGASFDYVFHYAVTGWAGRTFVAWEL